MQPAVAHRVATAHWHTMQASWKATLAAAIRCKRSQAIRERRGYADAIKSTSSCLAFVPVSASPSLRPRAVRTSLFQVEGYGHQFYLEQEHLLLLSSGPVYPAPSPDRASIAFAHQGWLWLLDIDSGVARRLTDVAGIEFRPRSSLDGQRISFVRNENSDTRIGSAGSLGSELPRKLWGCDSGRPG